MNQSNDSTRGTIIVVDDNPDNLNLLVNTLSEEGYHVRAAVSGKLAISSAQTVPPDLILLDILMPEIDGYEICQQLKSDDRTRDIPIIFISALDDAIDKAKGFEVGGVDYISKPFQHLEVIARVENQLRLRMAQKQLQEQNLQLENFSKNLKELHRLNTTDYSDFNQLSADYLQTGCKILGFTTGVISKVTGNICKIEAVASEQECFQPQQEFDFSNTFCAEVVKQGKSVAYSHPINSPSLWQHPVNKDLQIQSYLGTPIWVNERIYGTLNFSSPEVRKQYFNIHEREFIELMAESLGKYILALDTENKRKKAEEETKLLLNVTQAINAAADFETALQAALEQVCEASGWSYGEAWIPNNNQTFLECSPAWYYHNLTQKNPASVANIKKFRQSSKNLTFVPNQGVVGRVWQQGKAEFIENIQPDSDFDYQQKLLIEICGIKASLAVPIVVKKKINLNLEQMEEKQVLAVLVFFLLAENLPKTPPEKERLVELVSAVATQLGAVIQHKQTEAELCSLFQAMDDLIFVYDRHGICLKAVTNKPELLVNHVEGKINHSIYNNLPLDVADLHLAAIQRTLETKATQTIEYSLLINNQLKWFSGKISPLSSTKVMLVARDISDRKLIEQKLQTNEAEMRGIFESMTDIVLTLDLQKTNVQVMPTNYQHLDRSEFDLLTETVQRFYSNKNSGELSFWQPARQAIEKQQTVSFEYSLNVNNQLVWFNASISPLPGNLAIWVARDISDRVKAELELQQLASELEQRVKKRTAQLQQANQTLKLEINERILTQIELVKSEARFRLAVENIPDIFIIYDKQLRFEFINAKGLEIIGKSALELIGLTDREIFPADITSNYLPLLNEAVVTRQLQRGEITVNFPSVGERTMTFAYVPLLDEHGEIYQILGISHDITDRIQAESKLQTAYQRLQLLSELTLKIRQSLDLEEILQTTVTEVQKLLAAERVLIVAIGQEKPASIVQEVVIPGFPSLQNQQLDSPSSKSDRMEEFLQGECIIVNDVQELNISSAQLSFLSKIKIRAKLVVPIFIQNSIWGGLIIHQCNSPRQWQAEEIEILQQLADQIGIAVAQAQLLEHLEEKVAERTAELRHSEKQLRLITDALPMRICYVDAQERYRFNNKAYEEWFGLPLDTITGCKKKDILGETYYQQIKQYIAAALSGERVTFEFQEPEINGKNRYVSITYIPDLDPEERAIGFFGVAIDLSDRKAIEQMKDEFISVASHELRTPLTSIRGSLGLIATGRLGELSSRGQRMLEIAVNNTDRLHRLINDILDLARIESGRVEMVKEKCNAVDLITQAAEAMQSMAHQENITLHLEIERSPIDICADPDQILQTLTNLISNAIKFSHGGGTVWIGVTNQGEEILFQVRDTGRGIPADKLEAIFGRFQQVDASDSREKSGTGLGLPICREIVQRHGGKIWVESELNVGSTFYFTLPTQD
ncbi:PAS domain-containing protein [Oscillatoria salina]|uniref:PAS domain-containing protein n=1 Tax=Oscillatoria salina TaxID=331517 RepID=UPI0013B60227|nr:PAS domain-containing protein [Oscillatoria salina]MBZ8181254.1 PAS domain-containing protein [Oscillatoria salina IIICB1]NET90116.1 PAS domain-containing protein [Kamptonema sp. SIO1D9]